MPSNAAQARANSWAGGKGKCHHMVSLVELEAKLSVGVVFEQVKKQVLVGNKHCSDKALLLIRRYRVCRKYPKVVVVL